jgi:hypothetical protein
MHKIHKYQYGTGQYSIANSFFKNTTKESDKLFSQPLPTFNFKTGTFGGNLSIKNTPASGLGSNLLNPDASSRGNMSNKGNLGNLGSFGKKNADALGQVPELLETGLQLAGAKKATLASGGEQLYSQATSAL